MAKQPQDNYETILWEEDPIDTTVKPIKRMSDISAISDATRKGNFASPYIHTSKNGMPRSRELDPVTKKILGYALAPGQAFAYGMQDAGDRMEESKKAFQEGDYLGGGLGVISSLTKAGFSAATPFVPILSEFTIGTKVASDIIGEDAVNYIMSPTSSLLKPETLAGKSAAEIADLIYNIAVAKGIHIAGKKIKGKTTETKPTDFAEKIDMGKQPENLLSLEELKQELNVDPTQVNPKTGLTDFKFEDNVKPVETKPIEGLTNEQLPIKPAELSTKPIETPSIEPVKVPEIETQKTINDIPKVEGTGEIKTRGLSKTTETNAIESGIVEGIKDLPDYQVLKNDPQIKTASEMIANDLPRAKRIVLGEEKAPDGLLPGFIFKGLDAYAKKTGDVQLIKDLATSPYLAEQGTIAGQFVQSLRGQDPYSPTKATQEVIKSQSDTPRGKQSTKLEKRITELELKIKNLESDRTLKKAQREVRKEKRSYTKEQLKTERTDLYSQLYKETAQLNEGIPLSGKAVKIIGQLLKNYAEEGITNAAEIIDMIHTEVKDKIKGITQDDIRKALTNYGKESTKTRSELDTKVADLKKQLTVISKIQELESGRDPIKTIANKYPESTELKTLKEELKTKMDESDVMEAKTLERQKINIQKKIDEINKKIEEGDFQKEGRKEQPTDTEKQKLEKDLKDTRDRFNNIQKHLGDAISEAEIKNIVDMSNKISDAKVKMENSKRSELNEPKTKEEMEFGLAERRFANYIANLKQRAGKLTLEDFKANPFITSGSVLKNALGASRGLVSAFDDSFVGRQGLRALFTSDVPDFITAIPRQLLKGTRFEGNPEIPRYIWSKSLGKSLQIIKNTLKGKGIEFMDLLAAEQLSDKYYPIMQKMKVALSTTEEAFPTDIQIIDKVPVVGRTYRASEYAFTGTAHYMRYKLAQKMIAIMKATNVDMTDKVQLEAVGQMINSLTARGKTGGGETPGWVNAVIWSPKMIMGHLRVLTDPINFSEKSTSFTRKQSAYNLLKIMGGIVTIQTLANTIKPGSAETDPRSANWGKIKVGNTTFDFTGGMGAIVTLASRLSPILMNEQPEYKSTTGEIKKINSGDYGSLTGTDLLKNFLQNKTSPFASEVVAFLDGKTRDNERPTIPNSIKEMYVPFPIKTAQELLDDPNSADFVASMILDAFGFSANTFSTDPDLRKVQDTILRADQKKLYGKSLQSFRLSLEKALENGSITQEQYKKYEIKFEEAQQKAPEENQ